MPYQKIIVKGFNDSKGDRIILYRFANGDTSAVLCKFDENGTDYEEYMNDETFRFKFKTYICGTVKAVSLFIETHMGSGDIDFYIMGGPLVCSYYGDTIETMENIVEHVTRLQTILLSMDPYRGTHTC